MKKFVLLFISFIFSCLLNAQDWVEIQSNTNTHLNSVHFPSLNTGYVAGDWGTILKTIDGGNEWITLNSGTTRFLKSIFFINSDFGFAVGESSSILKTIDGGQTWTEKMSENNYYNFSSVYFQDSQNGFVAGDRGGIPSICKTTDGGETWIQKTVNTSYNYYLYSIDFVTSDIGFAVGNIFLGTGEYHSGVLKTMDGGETWNEQGFGNIIASLFSAFFIDSQIGFIVGGRHNFNGQTKGIVFKTTDGGETWNSTLIETGESIQSVFFTDEQTGYIVGLLAKVLKTNDGGSTWIPVNAGLTNYYSVYFSSSENGVAVGRNGKIIKSSYLSIIDSGAVVNHEPYPNPTNTLITIPLNHSVKYSPYLSIYNSYGQVIKHHIIDLNSDKVIIDVSMFAKGIYYYQSCNFSGKFIVY